MTKLNAAVTKAVNKDKSEDRKRKNTLQKHVAHVAELADALDSGKISWPFHAEFHGFTQSAKPL